MNRRVERFRVSRTHASLFTDKWTNGVLRSGYIVTRFGVVGAWTFEPHGPCDRAETFLSVVINGIEHRMFENKSYSPRGLATVAGRFARNARGTA